MIIVELEDHGQDFLRLYLNAKNVIVDAKPFQGWLWAGAKVVNRRIRRKCLLRLRKDGREVILKYPVLSIKEAA